MGMELQQYDGESVLYTFKNTDVSRPNVWSIDLTLTVNQPVVRELEGNYRTEPQGYQRENETNRYTSVSRHSVSQRKSELNGYHQQPLVSLQPYQVSNDSQRG